MDNTQGSSFIPNTPIRGGKPGRSKKNRKVYVLTYISFVLFFGALVATGAVFFLALQEEKNLSYQKQQLDAERSRFKESELQEVRELDARLKTAHTILNNTISVTNLMTSLEATLLRPALVKAFSFTKDGVSENTSAASGRTGGDTFTLALDVDMPDFNAVLFQREVLGGNGVLQGAEIHEVTYGTPAGELVDAESSLGNLVHLKITKTFTATEVPPGIFPGSEVSVQEEGALLGGAEEISDIDVVDIEENEQEDFSGDVLDQIEDLVIEDDTNDEVFNDQ